MNPQVDVVILTWNDGPLLSVAIDSALDSIGVDVRVFVVDNGSELPAVVPADQRVVLIRSPSNRGVAAGRNLGVALGHAELVCFLDSDARLLPETLIRLADALEAPGVGLVAPVFAGQEAAASAGLAPTLTVKLARGLNFASTYRQDTHEGSSWDVDFAIGACQLFLRSAFTAVGGLDESYFYGPEDVDLCLRLRVAGHRIVQVDVACEHPPRRRCRRPLTIRGARHAGAIAKHLWRHRGFAGRVRT